MNSLTLTVLSDNLKRQYETLLDFELKLIIKLLCPLGSAGTSQKSWMPTMPNRQGSLKRKCI
jgi:hypothetical protein